MRYFVLCETTNHHREEAYSAADVDSRTGKPLDVGHHGLEGPGNAKKQAGFFHKGILSALETDHRAGGNAKEVKVIANGHCHRKSRLSVNVNVALT